MTARELQEFEKRAEDEVAKELLLWQQPTFKEWWFVRTGAQGDYISHPLKEEHVTLFKALVHERARMLAAVEDMVRLEDWFLHQSYPTTHDKYRAEGVTQALTILREILEKK